MLDLRKSSASFFKFLEENNVTDLGQLPPEQMKIWLFLKNGQRLNMFMESIEPEEEKKDNVIPLRRIKQAAP